MHKAAYNRAMPEIPQTLSDLLADARVKTFPKGQIIIYAGDQTAEVLILKSGIVKVHDIDESGNEKILHIVKPFAIIPFVFFSGSKGGTKWFYTAVTDTKMHVLPVSSLNEAILADPKLGMYLMHSFSQDMHELLVRLSSLGKTITRDKLTAALKFLAVCHATSDKAQWRQVSFPVSHQLLADMTGVTRESAAISMKELEDDNIVRYPKVTTLEINVDKLLKS